jgi:NAD-dependent SIR2 family protein deacetylase
MANTRRIGPPPLRFLRPAVQSRLHGELLPGGTWRSSVLKAAGECDLLLIAGVSFKCKDTFDLIYDAAAQVHARYGGVVYINHLPIKGRNTNHCIDFHLQVDLEECASRIMQSMDEASTDFSEFNSCRLANV